MTAPRRLALCPSCRRHHVVSATCPFAPARASGRLRGAVLAASLFGASVAGFGCASAPPPREAATTDESAPDEAAQGEPDTAPVQQPEAPAYGGPPDDTPPEGPKPAPPEASPPNELAPLAPPPKPAYGMPPQPPPQDMQVLPAYGVAPIIVDVTATIAAVEDQDDGTTRVVLEGVTADSGNLIGLVGRVGASRQIRIVECDASQCIGEVVGESDVEVEVGQSVHYSMETF